MGKNWYSSYFEHGKIEYEVNFEIDYPLIKYSYMMTWSQNIVKQANRCAKIVNMMTVLPNNAKK